MRRRPGKLLAPRRSRTAFSRNGHLCYKSLVNALTISIIANVVLGIVLLGLLYRKRESDADRLTEPEQALAHYRTCYPTANGHVDLAADGRAALLELADGSLGLVERCGQRWSVRVLEPREILGIERGATTAQLRAVTPHLLATSSASE